MSSNFVATVRIAITLVVSALFVTGCSKSTSDGQPTLVVVEPTTSASDGTKDNTENLTKYSTAISTTDSTANEVSNSMSGVADVDTSINQSEFGW